MNIQPRIELIAQKLMIGKKLQMSFAHNKTFELWRSFMPERRGISNIIGKSLYSIEIYKPGFFGDFDPHKSFEKWAALEVRSIDHLPGGLESLIIPGGLYAIFLYKGLPAEAGDFYRYIFQTWLPTSGYLLDNRPHMACMGDKYRQDDPLSEEEILIPISSLT